MSPDEPHAPRPFLDRRGRVVVLGLALVLTLANAVKPFHIDDTFTHRIARQIVEQPLDPYGFDIFWAQWPQPVHEELTPPVLPYWSAIAVALFGDNDVATKLWLFPFPLLLAGALYVLLRRFAPGTEAPLTAMTVLSPAFLPAFNMMQDVPAVALGLTALALYLHACDRRSTGWTVLAGLVAGMAAQTKYTAVGFVAALLIHAVLFGKVRRVLLVVSVAAAVFVSWEGLLTLRYGQGMFLGQFSMLWWSPRLVMLESLVRVLGGTVPLLFVLGLGALGAPPRVVLALAAAVVAGFGLLLGFPLHGAMFFLLGMTVCLVVAIVGARSILVRGESAPLRAIWSRRKVELFLLLWLVAEIGLYFNAAPFPAVRRVMGVIVAATFLVARSTSARMNAQRAAVPLVAVAVAGILLGLGFCVVDFREASAQREGALSAARVIARADADATVWYVGHWGFQHYAEAAGMVPVIPDVSTLHAGDWLVIPDRVHQQEIRLAQTDLELHERLVLDDPINLFTGQGYYGGNIPLQHATTPRLNISVYRIRRDFPAQSGWSALALYRWARFAPERTATSALPALRRVLNSRDPASRQWAAAGLAELGPRASVAGDDLIRALADPHPGTRYWAAVGLGRIGDPAVRIVAALERASSDSDDDVRQAAVAALDAIRD